MTIEIKLVFRNRIAHLVLYLAYNNFIEKFQSILFRNLMKFLTTVKVFFFVGINFRGLVKNDKFMDS
jgi:hypothetical protein